MILYITDFLMFSIQLFIFSNTIRQMQAIVILRNDRSLS